MRCYHGDHCLHCGGPMAPTDFQCVNDECLTEASTLPPWPWSRCFEATCNRPAMSLDWNWFIPTSYRFRLFFLLAMLMGIIGVFVFYMPAFAVVAVITLLFDYVFFRIVKPAKMIRLVWQPVIGTELLIIGIFFLSKRVGYIGVALILAWILDRFAYGYIRELSLRGILEVRKMNELRRKFRTDKMDPDIDGYDEAEKAKTVKDSGDKVKATEFGLTFAKSARIFIGLGVFLFVVFILITLGPGALLSREKVFGWIANKADRVKTAVTNSKVVKKVVKDVREAVESKQMRYEVAYTKLSQWMSDSQIVELFNTSTDYKRIVELADQSDKMGAELLDHLKMKLTVAPKTVPRKIRQDFVFEQKSYWQKFRETLWTFFAPVVLLLSIVEIILFLVGIFVGLLHWIYSVTDEWADKLKMYFHKGIEAHRKKEAEAAGREYVPQSEGEIALLTKMSAVDIFWDFVFSQLKRVKLFKHLVE